MNVLEIKNVYKKYASNKKINTMVLKNINLSIKDNEFVGIMEAQEVANHLIECSIRNR